MNNIINQNLDEIISIKNQLSNVLLENGVEAGSYFSEYPSLFRSVIASGGGSIDEETLYSYIGDYLDSYNYIDQDSLSSNSYATQSYVADYVNTYAPTPDLSSYVTKAELSGMSYATQSYVIDKINAIPSIDLSSYVTHTELNNAGYITTGYISTHDIVPADDGFYQLGNAAYKYLQVSSNLIFTDEVAFGRGGIKYDDVSKDSVQIYTSSTNRININSDGIIPAYTNTYTLGDADHFYSRTYTTSIQSGSGGMTFRIGSSNTAVFGGGDFRPSTNEGQSLGRSTNRWNNTYTSKIYADTAYISNYNNFIWTGTSAEYALLDNYTSYQFYLVQES